MQVWQLGSAGRWGRIARRVERSDAAIEQLVADPMIRAAMAADEVDPEEFAGLLRSVACSIAERAPARRPRQRHGRAALHAVP